MSQVAGRISVMRGATLLFRNRGGRGVLLGGVDGSDAGHVLVLGAGVAGSNAVGVAVALGAKVDVVDINEAKLQTLKDSYRTIETHISSSDVIARLALRADLVIGAVLLAGRRAPVVLPEAVIKKMHRGSVIVDIAIDQGGCVEGIRSTSSEELYYVQHGVLHSAVPNMPAAVARTASQSLSSAIFPYVSALSASSAVFEQWQSSPDPIMSALHRATAIQQNYVVDAVLKAEVDSLA
jgi:alanine dehydrogenase